MLASLLGAACDDDGPSWGPFEMATLVADEGTVILRPGETITWTWTVDWPDGERPEDVLLRVHHDRGYDGHGAVFRTDLVHGEVVTYTFTAGAPHIYDPYQPTVRVTGATRTEPVVVEGSLRIQVLGGPADAVFPPVDRVDLAVGEVRPFTAYAAGPWGPYVGNPNVGFGQRAWSDDALGFAVDDPGVATVDAGGVITGVAPGSTTLQITSGEASVGVPLTVADVPLAAPPFGAFEVFSHQAETYNVTWNQPDGPLETKAALDADGWPMLAVTTQPGLAPDRAPRFQALPEPTVLARWTGTGFGYETLPMAPQYRYPVLTTDDDGHVYLLLHEDWFDRLVVWDRPGDVVTGGWRERELPWGVDLGEGPMDLTEASSAPMPYFPAAVLTREEGGVWVAWASHHDLESEVGWCPVNVRLAAVTPDTLEVVEVARIFRGFENNTGYDCHYFFASGLPVRLALRPSDVGSAFPTVALLGFEEPGLTEWRHVGGVWAGESIEVVNATFDNVWDDIAPVVPVEGPDDLARAEETTSGTFAWQGRRDGERHAVLTGPDPAVTAQPWWSADPLHSAPLSWWYYLGHATDRERVFLFADPRSGAFDGRVLLNTSRMPFVARVADAEATGRRLVVDGHPFVPDGMHGTSTGARFLRRKGALWASDGPDEPLEPIWAPPNASIEVVTWQHGDDLRMVPKRADGQTGLWSEFRLVGEDWQTARTFSPGGGVVVAAPTDDGGAWVVTEYGAAFRLPADASDPVVAAAASIGRPADAQITGVAAQDDGGLTVVTSMWDAFHVTSLAPDGGVRMAEASFPGAAQGGRMLRTPSGRLLLPAVMDFRTAATQGLWASDDDGETWTWKPLGDQAAWSDGGLLVSLADGGIALVGTKGHGWYGHQAAVAISDDDGETWSEPLWIRPEGGSVQFVGQVAAVGDGDLLVVLRDTSSGLVPSIDEFIAFGRTGGHDVLVEVTP